MIAKADSTSDAVLMTLAGIAYGAPKDIGRYIEEAEPTASDWQLDWLPSVTDTPPNFAFAAHNTSDGTRVVSIRGTYPNPLSSAYWEDGRQDSPFGTMASWPGNPEAKISAGTATGFENLKMLANGNGITLQAYLATVPDESPVFVTGHSLGGTLAPVLALWFTDLFPGKSISVATYAGITPGNSSFAELFGPGTALSGRVRRVYNTLDTVPYGWDNVYATHDFYQPEPQGGAVVSALLLATVARLKLGGYNYTAVGDPIPLDGEVQPPSVSCDLVAYVLENLHQHMPDTYLSLLGAPPLPFSILFGTVVSPRKAAEPANTQKALGLSPIFVDKV
jgi:hypothetical protein